MARSQISGPQAAISSLLAVTTDLWFSMAALTTSAAAWVPPTSSATMCTSGCVTTSRQSTVLKTGPRPSGIFLVCTERLHTATTFMRYPSLSAIWSPFSARMARVLEPTLPSPTMPTLTSCIFSEAPSQSGRNGLDAEARRRGATRGEDGLCRAISAGCPPQGSCARRSLLNQGDESGRRGDLNLNQLAVLRVFLRVSASPRQELECELFAFANYATLRGR